MDQRTIVLLKSASPADRAEIIGSALGHHIVDEMQAYYGQPQLGGLGQQDLQSALLSDVVGKAVDALLPTLGDALMEVVEPAAKKAADIVGPVVRRELTAQLPTFAGLTGVVTGIVVIVGMVIGKKLL